MDKSYTLLSSILIIWIASTVSAFYEIYDIYNERYIYVETVPPPADEKVNLTVFYEALCPDSIDFIAQQLRPTYQLLNRNINLELVPYGNAHQTFAKGHWNFTCQHGPLECSYNKLHACALSVIKQRNRSFKFVLCLMNDAKESQHLHKCSMEYYVKLGPINKCRKSPFGDNLLAKMGERTHNFKPAIKWVPTIVVNEVYKQKDQDEGMKNLTKLICSYLDRKPRICEDYV